MDIIKALEWRYAVKKFDSEKIISKEQLDRIAKGLTLTATSMGMQLMKFYIVSSDELKQNFAEACYNQAQISTCSHIIVLCRDEKVTPNFVDSYINLVSKTRSLDKESNQLKGFAGMVSGALKMEQNKQEVWMNNQVYIALGNLLTICAAEKIDSCPMEGFMPEKVDDILGLNSKGFKSVLLCPIGFRAQDDKYASLPKVRREVTEIVEYL